MSATITELLRAEPTRPLRRAEYDRLVEAGAFEDEKIELLEGRLVPMSPQGTPHAHVIQKLTKVLVQAVGDAADVRVQCPLGLSDVSEPEPDFAVVDPDLDTLADHPREALLVVEVAQSSLSRDRSLKSRLYASAGIAEYWVVDVAAPSVLVHRRPADGSYTEITEVTADQRLTLAALPDVAISASEFLPGSAA